LDHRYRKQDTGVIYYGDLKKAHNAFMAHGRGKLMVKGEEWWWWWWWW